MITVTLLYCNMTIVKKVRCLNTDMCNVLFNRTMSTPVNHHRLVMVLKSAKRNFLSLILDEGRHFHPVGLQIRSIFQERLYQIHHYLLLYVHRLSHQNMKIVWLSVAYQNMFPSTYASPTLQRVILEVVWTIIFRSVLLSNGCVGTSWQVLQENMAALSLEVLI